MKLDKSTAIKFGSGYRTKSISIPKNLLEKLQTYKRTIATKYRSINISDIDKLANQNLSTTQKIDGELWFLVKDKTTIFLTNKSGHIIYGKLNFLIEASKLKIPNNTIIVGELSFKPTNKKERPEYILRNASNTKFTAFDIMIHSVYSERIETLNKIFKNHKSTYCNLVQPKQMSVDQIKKIYDAHIKTSQWEGIIIRTPTIIYKLKQSITVDAVIIGYALKTGTTNQVGTLAIGLLYGKNQYQYLTTCSGMNTKTSKQLHKQLAKQHVNSNWLLPHNGCLIQVVKPTTIIECKCSDLVNETIDDLPVKRMVLSYSKNTWSKIEKLASSQLVHPTFIKIRADKTISTTDIGMSQLKTIKTAKTKAIKTLKKSKLISKDVYTKTTKGVLSIKKILIWKTNKEQTGNFTAYVVCFVSHSPSRKIKTVNKVFCVHTKTSASNKRTKIINTEIKTGWNKV